MNDNSLKNIYLSNLSKLNLKNPMGNCELLNNIPLWVYVILGLFFIYLLYKFFNSNSNESFSDNKLSKPDLIIYNFNTKWCHWSKQFRPEWEKFMNVIDDIKNRNNNFNVLAVDVDCDDPNNAELISNYEIPGFPYILIETKNGDRYEYKNERTTSKLIETVNSMLSN